MDNSNNSQTSKRRRARQSDGTFKGDNPATPDLNEAWEPTELTPTLKEAGKYTVKPKINGQSLGQEAAGKYANNKAMKMRPTFGSITTEFH